MRFEFQATQIIAVFISQQVNPHKWKLYSLSDTDISDRSNSSAAFEFLREIEKRKEKDGDDVDMAEEGQGSSDKIVFKSRKRPSFNQSVPLKISLDKPAQDEKSDDHKSIMKGSRVLMPEYVIGQKSSQKDKKKKSVSFSSPKQSKSPQAPKALQLDHLFEGEDDDDDDDEE